MANSSDRPSIISVLRSSTLLNCLKDDEMRKLAETSHMAFAERGETIWINGASVGFVGICGTGFVKMVRGQDHGMELTHEIIGPGQVFGLLGAIDGGGCPMQAKAVSPTWYLKVPKPEFQKVYETNHSLQTVLVRRTTSRLRNTQEMLSRMMTGSAESRIATILMLLADSYGEITETGTRIAVPLTRQDIGEMAGTTVETTIRVMSRWQKQGHVRTDSKHVVLLNEPVLSCFLRS